MYLQFHLTSKCNLRCKHCYQESYEDDTISFENFKFLVDSFIEYAQSNNEQCNSIALTGGEPLLIKDFFKYLKYASDKANRVDILTNGTLITHSVAARLAKIPNLDHVQMSLEGPRPINDQIRGIGVYDKVLRAIEILSEYNVQSSISCTIAPYNYNQVLELYKDLSKTSLSFMWFDRCVPFKSNEFLTNTQFEEFLSLLSQMDSLYLKRECLVRPSAFKSLQFLQPNYRFNDIYKCQAYNHVCFLPNGDVMNCRRNNIVIGNAFKNFLKEIYSSDKIKEQKEQMLAIPDNCKSCKFAEKCRGGSKCITYRYYGDYNHKDINCILEVK